MRLSTSLIAVCATTMALATPLAVAADAAPGTTAQNHNTASGSSLNVGHPNTSGLSPECVEEVRKAREEHEAAVADGTAGSSFMGPKELANGILNGYGSSGMPKLPDCVQAEKKATEEIDKDKAWDKLPDWAQSARPGEKANEVFSWISVSLSVLSAVIGALVVLAESNPAIRASMQDFLNSKGIH